MSCWLQLFNVLSHNLTFVWALKIASSLLYLPFSVSFLSIEPCEIHWLSSSHLFLLLSMLLPSDYSIDQMLSLLSACGELSGSVLCSYWIEWCSLSLFLFVCCISKVKSVLCNVWPNTVAQVGIFYSHCQHHMVPKGIRTKGIRFGKGFKLNMSFEVNWGQKQNIINNIILFCSNG